MGTVAVTHAVLYVSGTLVVSDRQLGFYYQAECDYGQCSNPISKHTVSELLGNQDVSLRS